MQYDILHYRHCCRTTMIKGKESWNYRVTQSSRCWVKLLYIFIHLLTRTQEESNTKRNFFFFSLFFLLDMANSSDAFPPFLMYRAYSLSLFALFSCVWEGIVQPNATVLFHVNVWMFASCEEHRDEGEKKTMKALQTWEKLSKQSQEKSSSSFFILKRFLCSERTREKG